jgi:hypothetical protein
MSSNRNWQQKLDDALKGNTGRLPARVVTRGAGTEVAQLVHELRLAAQRFDERRDRFAIGKADICLDIARKVERFGSFASDKQHEFALKLIAWSLPRGRKQ